MDSHRFRVKKISRNEMIILIFSLFIGFALRFYTFDQKSLWIDEIHTFNESRDDLKGQIRYYKEDPTNLHPPLFFILTHLFYPFSKPERDLRIIPLIFGVLEIPMIYLLSRSFSSSIALPCTLALTWMTYHIYFTQDGRMYSLALFLGTAGLYFFIKHLQTSKKRYLVFTGLFYALAFHTSYSSIPFIMVSQLLWFYKTNESQNKPGLSSLLILNGATFLLCAPWLFFLLVHYRGQPVMDPLNIQELGPLSSFIYGIFNDWVPQIPLMTVSVTLLILFPLFSRSKVNAFLLLLILISPIVGLYLYCKLLRITQMINSRYFINFLPLFFITLFLSLEAIESKFERLKRRVRPKYLFLILFVASNILILPLYYHSEKQDFRGVVNYLHHQLKDGDKLFVKTFTYIPGILHYFKIYPDNRHYIIPYHWKIPGKEFEFRVPLVSQKRAFTIYHSNIDYSRYVADGSRLWILVGQEAAEEIKNNLPCVLKGYFDGSFANFRRFPTDASMYLFLWDPSAFGKKN
ncbi:MAG: hypothetical protein A2157_05345 [Deltaproteobacteria bacterium RBG_16_47_11]|nr:MAG: hypothetical protein A2157_05345 [Deltaproteobacteria bacterium RBG_16_47_11]